VLKVKKLSKSFKSGGSLVNAVSDISFSVADGKFASVIGRSGSGKSTLLSLMGGLDKPTSGEIIVGSQDITSLSDHDLIKYRGQKVGFVFQNYNLVPNLTAIENVMLPLEFVKSPKSSRVERAKEVLKEVGLTEDEMKRKPSRLSGGQQQRVAIARALVNKPSVVLADEPTGNLDSQTGKIIFNLLHNLSKSENTTIIVVTHDLSIAGKTDVTFKLEDGKLKGK
jgi:putative ABC transport system ATP-binding protein